MYSVVVVGFHTFCFVFDSYGSVSAIKTVSIDRTQRIPTVAEAHVVTYDGVAHYDVEVWQSVDITA